jgi:hypothetical protein
VVERRGTDIAQTTRYGDQIHLGDQIRLLGAQGAPFQIGLDPGVDGAHGLRIVEGVHGDVLTDHEGFPIESAPILQEIAIAGNTPRQVWVGPAVIVQLVQILH